MIHLAIDTQIYRQKPRQDSTEFKALTYLIKRGHIKLHVPYFVENEFGSFLELEHKKRIEQAIRNIDYITKHDNPGVKTVEAKKLLGHLVDHKDKIIHERRKSFTTWLNSLNAIFHELTIDETKNAIKSYFYGTTPLKEPKNRKDIPDAFIFQTFLNLQKEYKNNFYVIVQDGKLYDACKLKSIPCHKGLKEFLETEEVRALLENKIIDDNINLIREFIKNYITSNTNGILNLIGKHLQFDYYEPITVGDYPDGRELYITGVDEPHSIELLEEIEHYGDGLFVINFSSTIELMYAYEAYNADIDWENTSASPLNEYMCEVETTDDFSFMGQLEIDFGFELEDINSKDDLLKTLSESHLSITVGDLEQFDFIQNEVEE